MRRSSTVSAVATAVLLGGTLLPGCVAPLPVGTLEQREDLAAKRYPADVEPTGTLDIAVNRNHRTSIRLINREPRELRNVTLWLNQQYVGVIDRVRIGPDNPIPLNRFVNQHGETFPTGSFLTPDKADVLVSAERVTPDGQRERLIVWPDDRWFDR